jgi:plasmid stability protein
MQDKQKVTLYLPPGVHRQLKIRAAIDEDSMSALVEKAVGFYLKYPDKVEEVEAEAYGKTHQVHVCPECEAAMVMRSGQMVSLKNQPSVITDEFAIEVRETVQVPTEVPGEEALVTC